MKHFLQLSRRRKLAKYFYPTFKGDHFVSLLFLPFAPVSIRQEKKEKKKGGKACQLAVSEGGVAGFCFRERERQRQPFQEQASTSKYCVSG